MHQQNILKYKQRPCGEDTQVGAGIIANSYGESICVGWIQLQQA